MENEKTLSQQIAEISTQLKLSDIDQRTIDNAKIFMLDCLGCILSGSQIINAKVIRKSAQDISGDGPCTIFGTGAKVNPMMAALVNGTTGHSQDYDDDHREGTQHASVAVLPAVLALAEKYGKSGAEVLLAYIIGSDVTIRAGEAFEGTSYYAGWHLTGTCGVMGAAAGAAKLLGLDVAVALSSMLLSCLLSVLLPQAYQLTPELRHTATLISLIMSVLCPLQFVYGFCFFCLRAGGDTRSAMLLDSGYMWVVPVPAAVLMGIFLPGKISLWVAVLIVQFLMYAKVFPALWILKKGKWVKNITV